METHTNHLIWRQHARFVGNPLLSERDGNLLFRLLTYSIIFIVGNPLLSERDGNFKPEKIV